MPVSQISLSNTFSQWLYATQNIITEVNKIESGVYTKSANTLYITSSGVALFVTNSSFFGTVTSNSLFVSSNSTFSGVSANSISANTISSGSIYITGNSVNISTNTPRTNTHIIVNRGESANSSNADAIFQWNENDKRWKVRSLVDANSYNAIIDSSNYASYYSPGIVLLQQDISNTSSNVAATANTLSFVYSFANSAYSQANTATTLASNASVLSVGTVSTTRLGSGTANSTTYLAGDNTWKPVSAETLIGTTLGSGITNSSLSSVGNITSGTWSGSFGAVPGTNLTDLDASNISYGIISTARLGSGTANSTTYLAGNNTWKAISEFLSTNDTTTNATYYPVFVTTAGGSTAKTSSTKLYFTPSTGTLFSSNVKTSGLYDSSNRKLLIKDANGSIVWGG